MKYFPLEHDTTVNRRFPQSIDADYKGDFWHPKRLDAVPKNEPAPIDTVMFEPIVLEKPTDLISTNLFNVNRVISTPFKELLERFRPAGDGNFEYIPVRVIQKKKGADPIYHNYFVMRDYGHEDQPQHQHLGLLYKPANRKEGRRSSGYHWYVSEEVKTAIEKAAITGVMFKTVYEVLSEINAKAKAEGKPYQEEAIKPKEFFEKMVHG